MSECILRNERRRIAQVVEEVRENLSLTFSFSFLSLSASPSSSPPPASSPSSSSYLSPQLVSPYTQTLVHYLPLTQRHATGLCLAIDQ